MSLMCQCYKRIGRKIIFNHSGPEEHKRISEFWDKNWVWVNKEWVDLNLLSSDFNSKIYC